MLPADEDQMPLDGNPHPIPGNMVVNNNMMVLLQFPELGWINVPLHGQQQHVNQHQGAQMEEMQENMIDEAIEEEVNDSIVMNNSVANCITNEQQNGQEASHQYPADQIQVGMLCTIFLGLSHLHICNGGPYLRKCCQKFWQKMCLSCLVAPLSELSWLLSAHGAWLLISTRSSCS